MEFPGAMQKYAKMFKLLKLLFCLECDLLLSAHKIHRQTKFHHMLLVRACFMKNLRSIFHHVPGERNTALLFVEAGNQWRGSETFK